MWYDLHTPKSYSKLKLSCMSNTPLLQERIGHNREHKRKQIFLKGLDKNVAYRL